VKFFLRKSSLGKKLGTTRSGKDVYSAKSPGEYSGFSKEDHADAAGLHLLHGKNMPHARSHADLGGIESHNNGIKAHINEHGIKLGSSPSKSSQDREAKRQFHIMSGDHFKKALGTSVMRPRKSQGEHALGQTRSGKRIMSHPSSSAHVGFSTHDHMDAYRAHAAHISKLGSETHPNVIAHHREAMNHHFGLAVGAKLKKAREHVGKTKSGKKIHRHSHKHAEHHKGFSREDHADAMHAHHKRASAVLSLMEHLSRKGKHVGAFAKLAADHADAAHFHHTKHHAKR